MKQTVYNRYAQESAGWLHTGRSELVARVLGFFVSLDAHGSKEVLEVGAGVGQNVSQLRRFGPVDAMEIADEGVAALRQRADVRTVIHAGIPSPLERRYDIVCALDVIEHIEDDRMALRWMQERVRPGGLLLITVPAHPWFFTRHDEALGHHRRYTREAFRAIIPPGLELLADSHFNTWLFPLAIVSRLAWALKTRLAPEQPADKQPVPNQGLLGRLLLSVFRREIASTQPDTSRSWGLSYYACLRRRA
jgi:SAM-dependent methyltransferase